MKLATTTLFAIAAANEKKVPPRHPLQRLKRLNQFAKEWAEDNLNAKQAANWGPKFDRNTERFRQRWAICQFYDEEQLPHGGPAPDRKRRDDDDDELFERYDRDNPIRGIQQITRGYSKWAERYVAGCKLQPKRQVDRANTWFGKLTGALARNHAAGKK
jgi:hypothetical protein